MLTQEVLLQLQKYNFDLLARQEPSGRRRLRYMALAHIKDGKSASETAHVVRTDRDSYTLANAILFFVFIFEPQRHAAAAGPGIVAVPKLDLSL